MAAGRAAGLGSVSWVFLCAGASMMMMSGAGRDSRVSLKVLRSHSGAASATLVPGTPPGWRAIATTPWEA